MKLDQIDIAKRVRRQIEELPGHVHQRVKGEIAKLSFEPRPDYAEELRGNLQGRYKIKLDQYRIVYRINDELAVIEIVKAGKKNLDFMMISHSDAGKHDCRDKKTGSPNK